MTHRMEMRMQEISRRTAVIRHQRYKREVSVLSILTVLLTVGIGAFFRQLQPGGYAAVTGGYCSLLIRKGAGPYVMVGVVAFVVGVGLTVFCIRLKRKWKESDEDEMK